MVNCTLEFESRPASHKAKLRHDCAAAKRNIAWTADHVAFAVREISCRVPPVRRTASRRFVPFAGFVLLPLVPLCLGGCATTDTPAPTVAARLEAGEVGLGATTLNVAEAIGVPQLRLVLAGDSSGKERWLYTEQTRRETGTVTVGRYETLYDRDGRTYSHFIMPEEVATHETQVRVVALLTFEAGKLVAIDLPKS